MTYFAQSLDSLLNVAEEKVSSDLSQAEAKAAAEGMLISGSMWKTREKIILKNVEDYSARLIERLTKFESEHSPIKTSDFDLAVNSLRDFQKYCEELYEAKRNKKKLGYPIQRPAFDGHRMNRVADDAAHSIIGQKLLFKSQKSFLKWALGDTRKKLWSALLVFVGGIIATSFKFLWALISTYL